MTKSLKMIYLIDFFHILTQVLYVCHGGNMCSGPTSCQFSQSLRQWQSLIRLEDESGGFQSEVVEKAPMSLRKLDEKRESLSQMKEILAEKLESKQRHKRKKQQIKMMINKKKGEKEMEERRMVKSASPSDTMRGRDTPNRDTETPNKDRETPSRDRETPSNASANSTISEQGIFMFLIMFKENRYRTTFFGICIDIGDVIRTRHQQRRRTLSTGKKDSNDIEYNNKVNNYWLFFRLAIFVKVSFLLYYHMQTDHFTKTMFGQKIPILPRENLNGKKVKWKKN